MSSFKFNGIKKDYILAQRKKRPAWAALNRNILSIPGKPGGYLQRTDVEPLVIPVELVIESKAGLDFQKTKEDLADWLITEEPKELIFDDELDRTYYAVVDGSFDIDEFLSFGFGKLTFVCPDPYKYGPKDTAIFYDEILVLQNKGTADTYPLFRATVKDPITFLDIVIDGDYQRIGEPVNLEEDIPFTKEERFMWDQLSSTTGWTSATTVDGGSVVGTMSSDGTRFLASSYGTGSTWHGPSIKTSIPNAPITDFRVDAIVTMGNDQPHQMGRVEIYLLDASNNVVGKMAMKDIYSGSSIAHGEVRIGDNSINAYPISEAGDRKGTWNNFYGMLRLQRVGNVWTAYIAEIDPDTNQHHTRRNVTFVDVDNVFTRSLTQIQVHTAQYGTQASGTLAINDIKVYKINPTFGNRIPYIAETGDIIEFDHSKSLISINGEDRKDIKDFGARPFPLKKGENIIQVSPFESLDLMEVEWRPKYK